MTDLTYSQKRKAKLLEINNIYKRLIPTYESTTNQSDRTKISTEIENVNKDIMEQLDEYLSLIEKQIDIISQKENKLADIKQKITDLRESDLNMDNTANLDELIYVNKKWKNINIALIIICIILAIIFFFFALHVVGVK